MRRVILIGATLGALAVVLLLMGCQESAYREDPQVVAERESTRRTEITQSAVTERVDIREAGRTERAIALAIRAEQVRLMELDKLNHRESIFLYLMASMYGNMLWVLVGSGIGAVTCYLCVSRGGKHRKRRKTGKRIRKVVRQLRIEIAKGIKESANPDYGPIH